MSALAPNFTQPFLDFDSEDNLLRLIQVFDSCFFERYNTRLVKGAEEPIYLPANKAYSCNQIIFAHGFFASALHEISHWCVAGEQRRKKIDYGYWYEPDGRNAKSQSLFASVEAKPQAIEWLLSKACGKPFHVSLDNLSVSLADFGEFKDAIFKELQKMQLNGLTECLACLQSALAREFMQADNWLDYSFTRNELD